MFMSARDSKVRTKVQIELWHALGRPKNYVLFRALNHRPTIIASGKMYFKDMLDFMRMKLDGVQQPSGFYFGDLKE